MARSFADHFSVQAASYRRFRPGYPKVFFDFLAEVAPGRQRAWDCATGSGQLAVGLGRCFDQVVASDASGRQLAHAELHPRVRYLRSRAEACGLAKGSIDLVAVGQALHWLDLPAFYSEVRRVARAGAVLAAATYVLPRITPGVDAVVRRYAYGVVGAWWPPERRWVEEGYASLPFPFTEVPAPQMELEAVWTEEELLGYLGTWSSTQRYREAQGEDPREQVSGALRRAWGSRPRRVVRWPLTARVGRVA